MAFHLDATELPVESPYAAKRTQPYTAQADASATAQLEVLPLFAKWHADAAQNAKPDSNLEEGTTSEGYHWKGLLWQSLGFIAVENTYRLSTDHYMRDLIASGPYWTNYGISMQHWDMDRWSDGDDFLVDDIGHPMQGAVSGFIAIQNSPNGRNLRIGKSKAYWKSRFWALMWMTAYSTQQKIGPLGEAALGNAGGYTYALHCPFRCTDPHAEYTNNTGWTDFIMTPAGGLVWVIGEDSIDRFISDRIQGDDRSRVFPKIVRGALNPTRTMANALRLKTPWYRDYEHPEEAERAGVHFESDSAAMVKQLPRYEIFPHYNALSLPVNTTACTNCRKWTNGSGVGFSARLTHWVDFDSDVNYQPDASPLPSLRAGGSVVSGTFGLRGGFATPHFSLKAAVRPGFVSYSHAYFGDPSVYPMIPTVRPVVPMSPIFSPNALQISAKTSSGLQTGRITHFATALAINGDYVITRNFAIRGVIGNTPVRYLYGYTTPPGIGKPPYVNWLSHETFMTNENWNYQLGPVLRF